MNLKPLLHNQTVRIDPHGHFEMKDWNDSRYELHLHKETTYKIKGKKRDVNIVVPLNREHGVRCLQGKKRCKIPKQLSEEIQEAFLDDTKRSQFVADVRKALNDYPSGDDEEKVRISLQRIGNAFGVNSLEESSIVDLYTSGATYKTYYMVVQDSDNYYRLSSNRYGILLQEWRKCNYKKT